MISSQKQLAIALSRVSSFDRPSWRLEQYLTDPEIAAEVVWFAFQQGDIRGKVIADLGCGTGILGIGTAFFNPKKVYFVDIDSRSLKRLEESLKLFGIKGFEVICSDIKNFNLKVDVVFQNPPFGVKKQHADKSFLEKAFSISPVIYSFHKISTKSFLEAISKDNNYKITHFFSFDFPLKRTQEYHTKEVKKIKAGCWRLEKKD